MQIYSWSFDILADLWLLWVYTSQIVTLKYFVRLGRNGALFAKPEWKEA